MSISSSAVLVELNISVWTANKLDKGATDSVLVSNSASSGSAQVRKNLMAGTDKRKKIADYAARARLYHNQTTLSWSDKGARLLPTSLFMDYKANMNIYEKNMNVMIADFYHKELVGKFIEIDEKFAIGTKISEVFGIDDAIIEINITPNRGDCLGVFGIACDLSATGIGTLKIPKISKIPSKFKFDLTVLNQSPQDCPFISFRVLKNLKNCQSPEWLVKKIQGAGMNSISAIVDVTNYVMHILNRPMHAYDLNKIDKKIVIGNAQKNKKFISLKNSEHELNEKILTIADENNVLSVA